MHIVRFYADWCAPCRQFAPIVDKVAQKRNIEVRPVNIERSPHEDVTSIPTLWLCDENGVVAVHSGVMSARELDEWISESA